MKPKSSVTPVILGLFAVAILGAGAALAFGGPPKPQLPPEPKEPTQGYEVQPNCAGVAVQDDAAAMTHAKQLGTQAQVFEPGKQVSWIVVAAAALGVPMNCDLPAVPNESRVFTYRLFQAYLRGAVGAEPVRIDEASALQVAGVLRGMLVAAGTDPAELPEGLGA